MRCSSCGHGWLEGRATEIMTVPARQLPAVIEHTPEPDMEIRRLVEASREAQENFATNRMRRRKTRYAWLGYAAAVAAPFVVAAVFPESVVKAAPAAVSAYAVIGQDVNIYGLELRHVDIQHLAVDGTIVLAIKGEIANISGGDRKIPWLRFGLRDTGNAEVYNWTLDSGARPLRSGEITNFVTRVAAPPETAKNVEIRFAHATEIGSDAKP